MPWKLVEFTQPLTNGSQRIHWQPRPGAVSKAPSVKLADFELAQLWYLPDASFDRLAIGSNIRAAPFVPWRVADYHAVGECRETAQYAIGD